MRPRKFDRPASVILTLFIASVVLWAVVIEPRRLEIRELRAAAPAGAPSLVAVISDLHLAGVGTSLVPVRLGARPEIVFVSFYATG